LWILGVLGILIFSRFLLGIELPVGPHGAIAEMHRAISPAPDEDIGMPGARPYKNGHSRTKKSQCPCKHICLYRHLE
jgi:hypothetical protein